MLLPEYWQQCQMYIYTYNWVCVCVCMLLPEYVCMYVCIYMSDHTAVSELTHTQHTHTHTHTRTHTVGIVPKIAYLMYACRDQSFQLIVRVF